MGREVRRVPANWEHPKDPHTGRYHPLYDESFNDAMREWLDEWELWRNGEHWGQQDGRSGTDMAKTFDGFADYHGGPPAPAHCRPDWVPDERTHYQLYETVTEGTPLSPPLPTRDELAQWIAAHPDPVHGPISLEQARAFVDDGYAPSFIIQGGVITGGIQAAGK